MGNMSGFMVQFAFMGSKRCEHVRGTQGGEEKEENVVG